MPAKISAGESSRSGRPIRQIAPAVSTMLGEGVRWCAERAELCWVDIKAPALFSWHYPSGDVQRTPLPAQIGSFAFCSDGKFLVALRSGVHLLECASGKLTLLAAPEAQVPGNRLNDGRADANGDFWCGSMDDAETARTGWLWKIGGDGQVQRVDGPFGLCNGLDWAPDRGAMYFIDSTDRTIWVYEGNSREALGSKRVFCRTPPALGWPDGLVVDAAGDLFVAMWGGSSVLRIKPNGETREQLPVPVPQPTCCAFGGADLSTLFITTARKGLSSQELAAAPLSGGLFAIEGVSTGRPEHMFKL